MAALVADHGYIWGAGNSLIFDKRKATHQPAAVDHGRGAKEQLRGEKASVRRVNG